MNTQVLCQEIRARKETTPKNGAALGRLISGESDRRNELKNDGTPYAVKVARTVWSGGKGGDNLKALPITMKNDIYSELYERAKRGETFAYLSQLVISRENILLAYRNIKNNSGSTTAGIDKLTINNIKNLTVDEVVRKVRYILNEIKHGYRPKPNGDLRPLGIPYIWDRLIQQCFKQVLEPICEAKFSKHSYGFRPNKSAENAIADIMQRINKGHLHFVIEFDIKKFFDNVNHSKLLRQMWTLGCYTYKRHQKIWQYNLMIRDIQKYYQIATNISIDFKKVSRAVNVLINNRLNVSRTGRKLTKAEKARYGNSQQIRYLADEPIYPISYVQHKNPLNKNITIYTPDTGAINIKLIQQQLYGRSIEYADNRISLYNAQKGKCAVTGKEFETSEEIHCHHITPKNKSGTDEYENLILITETVHKLIQATKAETIAKYLKDCEPNLEKLNELRKQAGNEILR